MDKAAKRAIDGLLGTLDQGAGGTIYHDGVGPAVYRLEPTPLTVAACGACRYAGLIPSIPKVPDLVWQCNSCGKRYRLQPPAAVWVEGSRPAVIH